MLTQSANIAAIDEIRIHLIRIGLDQPALALRLGISKQYLNDILRGKRKAAHVRARLVEEYSFPSHLIFASEEKAA